MKINNLIFGAACWLMALMYVKRRPLVKFKNKIFMYSEQKIKEAFSDLSKKYPKDILQNTEKIFRLETSHFTSGGLKATNGAGMQGTSRIFPYGWFSLKNFWEMNPQYAPLHLLSMKENEQKDVKGSGIVQKFLVFPNIKAGIATVAQLLMNRENNIGSYFSQNEVMQKKYSDKIKLINSRYV